MSKHVEMCLSHFEPAFNCDGCRREIARAKREEVERFWAEVEVLPLDDPTPPKEYPK